MREIEIKDDVYNKDGKLLVAKGYKIHLDDEKELRYTELGIMRQLLAHKKDEKDEKFAREHLAEALIGLNKRRIKSKSFTLIAKASDMLQEILILNRHSNVATYMNMLSQDDLSWIYSHSVDVSLLSMMAAIYMGFSDTKVFRYGESVMVHDIGMTLIPKSIMNKKDILTEVEYEVIKHHCHLGAAILNELNAPYDKHIVMEHHEKLDGSGYPLGLNDKDISIESKIVMVSDTIDSATTDRPHRPGMPIEQIMAEIKESPDRYDSNIVDVFYNIIDC